VIELIANLIVFTALSGALVVVVLVVVKALIALGAFASNDSLVVSEKVCKYCGQMFLGSEVKCENCGAARQAEKPKSP